jgi:Flp pilus assembly protein TadD
MKLVRDDPAAEPCFADELRRESHWGGVGGFNDYATRKVRLEHEYPPRCGDDTFGLPEPTARVVIGGDAEEGGPGRTRPSLGRGFRSALVGSVGTLLLCAGGGWVLLRYQARGEQRYSVTPAEAAAQALRHELQEPTPPRAERSSRGVEPALEVDGGGTRPVETIAVVDSVPKIVSAEVRIALESLLREIYRDLRVDAEEQVRLREFRDLHGIVQIDVVAFEQDVLGRLAAAAEHLRLGSWWVERGAFIEAEREYRRAAEADPADPLVWAQLGAVLVGRGRQEEAFVSYQRAIELDPRCWLAHYNLAVWHARRGEVEQSLARTGAALTTLPHDATAERQAVVAGLLDEPAMASVRADPRFVRLIASMSLSDPEGRR